ncbi:MAG: sodium:solute symporter family protein [Sedimentisphaerales bacterium]|nr:sodium:solute symporter family protein [Sedimentisphaerales bacterium]
MIYLVGIFIYLLILTGIGIYKSRQVKTQADFTVAGRTLSPWIMVCTMLAVWIGTGSIVGNAGKTYEVGMAALFLPMGTFVGMILLSFIAARARNIEALSVPEIIGKRYGSAARLLAVAALIIAYMVIVSYQFNAGGMVLEVIAGKKDKVLLAPGDTLTKNQIRKGYFHYQPAADFTGTARIDLEVKQQNSGEWADEIQTFTIRVVRGSEIIKVKQELKEAVEAGRLRNTVVIKQNTFTRIMPEGLYPASGKGAAACRIARLPGQGQTYLHEPVLTAYRATIIAACFIIIYTMLAGLMSLAFTDIVTGTLIIGSLLVAFGVLLFKAGGLAGMAERFAAMADRPNHMKLFGVFGPADYINFLLPVFLLVMGDANQYQRIFASKNAKGARTAVLVMIFLALLIEELIIAEAWFASSLIPDPENGRFVLIYAARHFMPLALGIVFMVTIVGIIISTADSFLLVPATTFIKDIYQTYINPKASERRIVFASRLMVLTFGVIAWLVSLAFAGSTTVFEKAMYAFTVYGSAITPCLVAALFWKGATKEGAISSILAGTVTTLVWEEIIKGRLPAEIAKLDAVLPAITLSVVCLIVVSLLTRKQQPGGGD